jgi:hypothetical protein
VVAQNFPNVKASNEIEESIKSEIPVVTNPINPIIPATFDSGKSHIEDSSQSLSGVHPKMRRVRNPYGSSEFSGSHKSNTLS